MNKLLPILFMICFVEAGCKSKKHSTEIAIGLEVEYKVEIRKDPKYKQIFFVYLKVKYEGDLYQYIKEKAKHLYSEEKFKKAVELPASSIPQFDLQHQQYKSDPKIALKILSKDFYSRVYVIDYENYVVLMLSDAS